MIDSMLSLINTIAGRMSEDKKETDTTTKEEDVKTIEETAPTDVKEEAKPNDPEETPANEENKEKDNQVEGSKETPVRKRTRRQRGDSEKSKEEEVEDINDEETQEEEKESPTGKRTRQKKSVATYQPIDFKNAKYSVTIMRGRGMKFGDIPAIRAQVESFSMNSEEMKLAHRLLYKYRGRGNAKEYKRNILAFNGYLREMNSDEDEETLEEEDEEAERYYSIKAYKLNTQQIKTLLDFFSIDRSPEKGVPMNKDVLIDRLLDFLGAPSLDLLENDQPSPETKAAPAPAKENSSPPKTKADPAPAPAKESSSPPKKKTDPAPVKENSSPPKKRKRTEKESEDDDGDDDEEEMPVTHEDWVKKARIEGAFFMVRQHSKGKAPSDEALRQWVQAYVTCFDMDTASIKHAIKTASAKFGVDMRDRKDRIREYLVSEI